MTPEGRVKKFVDCVLHQHNAKIINPMTFGMGKSGEGDKVACIYGRFVQIETKAGKKKPTELQKRRLRETMEAGGIAVVVNETNLDDFADFCSALGRPEFLPPTCLLPEGTTLQESIVRVETK